MSCLPAVLTEARLRVCVCVCAMWRGDVEGIWVTCVWSHELPCGGKCWTCLREMPLPVPTYTTLDQTFLHLSFLKCKVRPVTLTSHVVRSDGEDCASTPWVGPSRACRS